MKVNVKCFANLSEAEGCNFENATAYDIEPGKRVEDLIDSADLSADDVSLVFVNGKKVAVDAALSEGDRVGLFPATGGM